MEIKVGDKVRVSKDAPIHIIGSASEIECKAVVLGTDADIAVIGFRTQEKQRYDAYEIPTKYLIKVEDEAKEPKFNVGDKVVVHYSTGDKMGRIQEILNDGCYDVDYGGGCTGHYIIESRLYPYTEPTELIQPKEQTEAEEDTRIRQMEAELDEFRKAELDRVLHPEKYHTYEVTVDNVAMDWQRYEADLAKDIALKVANKYNDPKEAADYAVSVAKAVVENLKKK